MNINERNRTIKKALCKVYTPSDVSVTGGRGTATGWVTIKVMIDRPSNCTCTWDTSSYTYKGEVHTNTYRTYQKNDLGNTRSLYCPSCKELYTKHDAQVKKIVYTCGAEFYTYTVDDGYNSQSTECLTSVEIK